MAAWNVIKSVRIFYKSSE